MVICSQASESQDSLEFQETLNKGKLMTTAVSTVKTMVSPVLDDAMVAQRYLTLQFLY